jgi:hypothetical protein
MSMALLPLLRPADRAENGYMNANNLFRRLVGTIREMNDAVKLTTELRLSRGLGFGDEAPASYAEFLLRTSATSVHEPSAARRQAAGRDDGSAHRSCRC